jgi:hypothetical protein
VDILNKRAEAGTTLIRIPGVNLLKPGRGTGFTAGFHGFPPFLQASVMSFSKIGHGCPHVKPFKFVHSLLPLTVINTRICDDNGDTT